jgi:hypothetical protein
MNDLYKYLDIENEIDNLIKLRKEEFSSEVEGLLSILLFNSNFHHWGSLKVNEIGPELTNETLKIVTSENLFHKSEIFVHNTFKREDSLYESFQFNFVSCKFKIEITKNFKKILPDSSNLHGDFFLYHNELLVCQIDLISKVLGKHESLTEFSDLKIFKKGGWISDLQVLCENVSSINYRLNYIYFPPIERKIQIDKDTKDPGRLKRNFDITEEDLDNYHDLVKKKRFNEIKGFIIKTFKKIVTNEFFIGVVLFSLTFKIYNIF